MKLSGEENLSLFERITHRRRSSNPTCWVCKDYPNCGMCQLKGSLRHPPVSVSLPDDLRGSVVTICKMCDDSAVFRPTGGRVSSDTIKRLEQFGVISCCKRGGNYSRSYFILNIEYSKEVTFLFKRYHVRR